MKDLTIFRVDLGLATQAPHRPVRADFPHTVPQTKCFTRHSESEQCAEAVTGIVAGWS